MYTLDNLPVTDETDIIKAKEFNFLDSIEIENYLNHEDWSLLKIMNEIQEDHGAKYKEESYIFNAIDQDDFIEYILKRYKGKYTFYVYMETRVKIKDN